MVWTSINRGFFNVVVLSLGSLFTFSAFQTMSNLQIDLLKSINEESPDFTGDGYTCFIIIFGLYSLTLFFSPTYTTLVSSQSLLLFGTIINILFVGIFFWPQKILLYLVSALQGVGNACLSINAGRCVEENSNPSTISRNTGIFWAHFQLSLVTGNLLIYFTTTGEKYNNLSRRTIFVILTILAVIGCAILVALRKPPMKNSATKTSANVRNQELEDYSAKLRMKKAFKIVSTPNMMVLSIAFLYTGLIMAFFSVIYPASVGFTEKLGEFRKGLVNLTGAAIGIGELIGAILSSCISSKVRFYPSSINVVLGFLAEVTCFVIVFLNFPNDAPFKNTNEIGLIEPLPILAIIGGFCLGFGDACFSTQLFQMLVTLHKKDISYSVAFGFFCQSLTMVLAFALSDVIGLYLQVSIFFVIGIFGTVCFIIVDSKVERINDLINDMSARNTHLSN